MSFVAVHLGAGSLSSSKRQSYSQLAAEACSRAMQALKAGADSLAAVTECMSCLEDDELTNAGVGANLTVEGTVELDASVMCGASGAFGGVAGVTRLRNPCAVAAAVLAQGSRGIGTDGRVPPMLLCAEGAHRWAAKQGFALADPQSLITERSKKRHARYMRMAGGDASSQGGDATSRECDKEAGDGGNGDEDEDGRRLDTVGAVCVDRHGAVCAAVSSGGLALKECGRVGQAAMYGCGCWAEQGAAAAGEDVNDDDAPSIAVSTSGTGEHLISSLMAQSCGAEIRHSACAMDGVRVCMENFLACPRLGHVAQPLGGVLAIGKSGPSVEVSWGHSTPTFLVAYMSETSSKAHVSLSQNQKPGGFTVEGRVVRLRLDK